MRQYYLADKERIELRGDGSYDMTDDVQLLAELWYGNDDYAKPDIGLSEGEDYGYDLSLNFNLLDGLSGHVFTINRSSAPSNNKQTLTLSAGIATPPSSKMTSQPLVLV